MILNSQGDPRSETEVSFNKKQFVFKCPARNITALIQGRTLMAYDHFVLYSLICIKLEELEKEKKNTLGDSWGNSWPILRVIFHINYNHQVHFCLILSATDSFHVSFHSLLWGCMKTQFITPLLCAIGAATAGGINISSAVELIFLSDFPGTGTKIERSF